MDYRRYAVDYIEGRAAPADFEKIIEEQSGMLEWLQSIVPEGETSQCVVTKSWDEWWLETPDDLRAKLVSGRDRLAMLSHASFEEREQPTIEMVRMMKKSLDYIERMDAAVEMFLNLYDDPSAPEKYRKNVPDWVLEMLAKPQYCVREVPYNVREAYAGMREKPGTLARSMNIHSMVSRIVMSGCPELDLKPDQTLSDRFGFMLDVLPSYIGGAEAEESGIFEKLIAEVPENLPKAKRTKLVKEKIKEAFHVSGIGSKHPRWMQEPEWPMKDGRPMRFVRTKTVIKGELFHHVFIDDETGEERIVEDGT